MGTPPGRLNQAFSGSDGVLELRHDRGVVADLPGVGEVVDAAIHILGPTGECLAGQDEVDLLDGRVRAVAVLVGPEVPASTSVASAVGTLDRKSTRLNSSHSQQSRMPSSA